MILLNIKIKVDKCNVMHSWKEIRHDNIVTWLAYWNDPINNDWVVWLMNNDWVVYNMGSSKEVLVISSSEVFYLFLIKTQLKEFVCYSEGYFGWNFTGGSICYLDAEVCFWFELNLWKLNVWSMKIGMDWNQLIHIFFFFWQGVIFSF